MIAGQEHALESISFPALHWACLCCAMWGPALCCWEILWKCSFACWGQNVHIYVCREAPGLMFNKPALRCCVKMQDSGGNVCTHNTVGFWEPLLCISGSCMSCGWILLWMWLISDTFIKQMFSMFWICIFSLFTGAIIEMVIHGWIACLQVINVSCEVLANIF